MNRSLRNENRFMYMLSTCLSDFCTGVTYYYAGVMDVRDNYDSPTRTFSLALIFLGLSFIAILAAQADRYVAVSAPFIYSQRMTRNRTLLVILGYWVYLFLIVVVNNSVPVEGSECYLFKNDGTNPLRILARVNAVVTPLLYIRGCTPLRSTIMIKVWRIPCYKSKGVKPQNMKTVDKM
ncbi:hypothetical protein G5714_023881 [Onychostoma macrolepis]|uniref:G-protein coupled receptors family 1 profile domain-containing protein n=1 Tax=Onychostoma macrolepis TaxID=369639 RepID=A0A7J6BKJ8_9TELE|nr:hypothetical protein G5714_023881 [Onychostoma macrolepis]